MCAMFGRAAAAIECFRVCAVSMAAATTPTASRAEAEPDAGGSRDAPPPEARARNAQAVQTALHLREMTEAGDRCGPGDQPELPPHGGRQVLEEHLDHTDRQVSLELPSKKSSSGTLHSTRRTSAAPRRAASPTPARLSTPAATSSGVIPRAAARITVSLRKPSRLVRVGRGDDAEATNTPLPRRAPRTRSA